jgi:hypothetical protein
MRIYPLRTTSKIWKIKLYSKHICNDDCKLTFFEEQLSRNSSLIFIIENPSYDNERGRCSDSMKYNHALVNIFSFDENDPCTIFGDLLFEHHIVIPDPEIYINLEFPLKKSKKILVKHEGGFSLTDIISKIKQIYIWAYQEEEKTSSVKTHIIADQCECKINYKSNSKKTLVHTNIPSTCPICLEALSDTITECNHSFHMKCIEEWIENDKDTCPMCRSKLFTCKECKDGIVYKQYIGKVIPREERGLDYSRNQTDGVFQIYGYDIENLYLRSMTYNSVSKTLNLDMTSIPIL